MKVPDSGHFLLPVKPEIGKPSSYSIANNAFLHSGTLQKLVGRCNDSVALLTAELEDPQGYGRIVRERGNVREIVEEKDANAKQKLIREVIDPKSLRDREIK